MEPRFSVALCTYNGALFIGDQLRSILDQEPSPVEIVVSDDRSSDNTLGVVRDVVDSAPAPSDGGVLITLLVDGEQLGVTKNFERAMRACSGEFIALSDQDDYWHPGRLALAAAAFAESPEVVLLHTDARLVDDQSAALGATLLQALEYSEAERRLESSGNAFPMLLRRNVVTGATTILRRSLLDRALPFPDEWVHDEWLAVIAAATAQLRLLDTPTIDYRQHVNNQIGVTAPTLAYKVRRVLEARGDRSEVLARKFGVLAKRLEALPDVVPAEYVEAARLKAQFEEFRAQLPRQRWRRVAPVLSAARAGRYTRFASQGRADIIRDVLQGA